MPKESKEEFLPNKEQPNKQPLSPEQEQELEKIKLRFDQLREESRKIENNSQLSLKQKTARTKEMIKEAKKLLSQKNRLEGKKELVT